MADRTQTDDIDWALVGRAFAGELCPDARAAFDRWVAADPARARMVETLRAEWHRSAQLPLLPAAEDPIDRTAALQVLRQRMSAVASMQHPHAVPHLRPQGVGGEWWHRVPIPAVGRRAVRSLPVVAGMLLVALGIGLAVHSLSGRNTLASLRHGYATATGQRLSVTLVDGTQLTLAPASRVHLAADYGRGAAGREVELEGEAYFAVAHDAAHPFVVRARGAVARDVGTAFDVRAYPEDAEARIAVAEGVVAVTNATQLRAGDVAMVGGGAVTVEHGVDVKSLAGWRAGRLVFERIPLGQVVRDLSRWYGADIRVRDSALADQRVSVTFGEPTVASALALLAPVAGARVERAGSAYMLVPRPNVGRVHESRGEAP